MTFIRASRAALFLAVLAAGCTSEQPSVTGPSASAPAASVQPSTIPGSRAPDGWQTIEYSGVRVDVPGDWVRVDTKECGFEAVRWQPAGAPACRVTSGLVFYLEATFDPAYGPGIHQGKDGTWSGYVFAGEYAVFMAGTDRQLIQDVLDTARPRVRR
jgi:hypothetical protein